MFKTACHRLVAILAKLPNPARLIRRNARIPKAPTTVVIVTNPAVTW